MTIDTRNRAEDDPLRIAVCGLGFGRYHVATLANMPEFKLTAVADLSADDLDGISKRYGCKAYRDGVDMMKEERLDAVSICVSPCYRKPLLEKAAASGCHVFVEKPWASNADHARDLAEVCAPIMDRVMAGFSFRYHPAMQKLKALVEGDLGAPWLLNGQYVFEGLPPADHWLWQEDNGNGFINENTCHLLDAICFLAGYPERVYAEGGMFMGRPSEEAAVISMRFPGGALATLSCGGIGVGSEQQFPRLDLVGANGQAALEGRNHIWESLRWSLRDEPRQFVLNQSPETLAQTRYADAMRVFADGVRRGEAPACGVQNAVRMVELCMAVKASIRRGQPVQVPG